MGSHGLYLELSLSHSPFQRPLPPLAALPLPQSLRTSLSLSSPSSPSLLFSTSNFLSVSNSRDAPAFIARAKQQTKSDAPGKEKEEKLSTSEEEYEEEEMSWIQEKTEDFVQMTGAAVNAIPGPRVGSTTLPWLLAVPVGYLSITFVIAVIKTILKYNSSKAKRRRLVGKNAFLCQSIDEYFPSRRLELDSTQLKQLERKTNFDTKEVLRKYIRYALNERPFNPDLVADLIHLRKVSQLEDADIVEILNEVSRRIVKEKGPVVMDTRGFTEKGLKRKAAVQALFSKLLYLSELDEFCATTIRGSMKLKEIFGVTDEDVNSIRIETLSEVSDVESLEKMVYPSDPDIEEGQVES